MYTKPKLVVRGDGPYGENEYFKSWIKERSFRYLRGHQCLHWVSVGRCGVAYCMDCHGSRRWMDHISCYIDEKNGERVLICQPYHFSDVKSLAEACEKFNLRATVHGDGWYGHGTVCIELRRKYERCSG
jgi:hypothetical protein